MNRRMEESGNIEGKKVSGSAALLLQQDVTANDVESFGPFGPPLYFSK